jgi:hypothetical protein
MRSITHVLRNFKLRWTEELETAAIEQACRDAQMSWIESTLNPIVTIQLSSCKFYTATPQSNIFRISPS